MTICEKCGKENIANFGSGKFCSRSCANSRTMTESKRAKITLAVNSYNERNNCKRHVLEKHCIICNAVFITKNKNKKFCSQKCSYKHQIANDKDLCSRAGKASAKKQVRRSKNEIAFADLCIKHFKNVKCNEQIFNGWDADVIIEDFKIAVLWNGMWHYKKCNEKHSLEQVQVRDTIKLKNITACGYTPYIICDMGKFNLDFVNNEFIKFINSIGPIV